MTDIFWNSTTPIVAPSTSTFVPVRVRGAAADGSQDTFAQILFDAAVSSGANGLSAYQIWLQAGNSGTVAQFLTSLIGPPGQQGTPGASAYQVWLAAGNTGSVAAFLASIVGAQGAPGAKGDKGDQGQAVPIADSTGSSASTAISQRAATASAAPDARAFITQLDKAPAIILPPSTKYLDFDGRAVPGDGPRARYRQVATQPSHPGKVQDNAGNWYEYTEPFAVLDHFRRTGDTNDLLSMLRLHDYAGAKGYMTCQLLSRNDYDLRPANGANGIDMAAPIQFQGVRGSRNGALPGYQSPIIGTCWNVSNDGGNPTFRFGSTGNAAGTGFNDLTWIQDQRVPSANWTPADYADVISGVNVAGGIELGRNHLYGVTRFLSWTGGAQIENRRLTGQVFTRCMYLDNNQDLSDLGVIHMWPWRVPDNNVYAWQQANLDTLVLGRVDGLKIDRIFSIVGRNLIRVIQSPQTPSNGATFVQIGQAYADLHHCMVQCETGKMNIGIAMGILHGESITAPGTALSDACAIRIASGANDGVITVGSQHAGFITQGCVNNQSGNTAVQLTASHLTGVSGSSFVSPNIRVRLGSRPTGDGSGTGPGPNAVQLAMFDYDAPFPGTYNGNAQAAAAVPLGSAYRHTDGTVHYTS